MILPANLIRAIARGTKTQNRVPVKPGPAKPPKPGRRIAIQTASNKPATARIIITQARTELLGELTQRDAIAEGFRTRAEYAHYWMRRYDKNWPPTEEALCPNCDGTTRDPDGQHCDECQLGTIDIETTPDPDTILDRFERRHAHHPVWVLTFQVEQDTPLYLHRDPAKGITTNPGEALRDEPEVLTPPSPGWQQRAEQRRIHALKDTRTSMLSGLPTLEDRLAVLRKLAKHAGVDVHSDIEIIKHRLNAIEKKVADKADQRRDAA